MFASDRAIAEAIVGKEAAPDWIKNRLPTLETNAGFPKVDPFHGGRPVPLVRLFYENYLRLPNAQGMANLQRGKEDQSVWIRSRSKRQA